MTATKKLPCAARRRCPTALPVLLAALALTGLAGQAMATLGQGPSPARGASTQGTAARMLAAVPKVDSPAYALHETTLANGTTVREYANSDGIVFAVAWRGPVLPDLRALLGEHFDTLQRETGSARRAGRRGGPVNLQQGKLVLRSRGRMRNFNGHAFAVDLVPAGVDINDVLR